MTVKITHVDGGGFAIFAYQEARQLCDPNTHDCISYILGMNRPNHPLPVIITHVRWNYEDNYVVVYDSRPDHCYDTFYVLGPPRYCYPPPAVRYEYEWHMELAPNPGQIHLTLITYGTYKS